MLDTLHDDIEKLHALLHESMSLPLSIAAQQIKHIVSARLKDRDMVVKQAQAQGLRSKNSYLPASENSDVAGRIGVPGVTEIQNVGEVFNKAQQDISKQLDEESAQLSYRHILLYDDPVAFAPPPILTRVLLAGSGIGKDIGRDYSPIKARLDIACAGGTRSNRYLQEKARRYAYFCGELNHVLRMVGVPDTSDIQRNRDLEEKLRDDDHALSAEEKRQGRDYLMGIDKALAHAPVITVAKALEKLGPFTKMSLNQQLAHGADAISGMEDIITAQIAQVEQVLKCVENHKERWLQHTKAPLVRALYLDWKFADDPVRRSAMDKSADRDSNDARQLQEVEWKEEEWQNVQTALVALKGRYNAERDLYAQLRGRYETLFSAKSAAQGWPPPL